MVPLFQKDTDGAALKKHLALNRRNYAAVDYEEDTGRLRFDFRVEKSPGEGETVSSVQSPASLIVALAL